MAKFNVAELIKSAQIFISKDIWKQDLSLFGKFKGSLFGILRIGIITVNGFNDDKCSVRASALTFFTMLSVVPVLALAFAIAKGFGFDQMLESYIFNSLESHKDIAEYLLSFTTGMLDNTRGGIIAGAGVIMLLYSVFKLLGNIEDAFNVTWDVKKSRSIIRKITDYITIMLIAPILLLCSISATIFISAFLRNLTAGDSFFGYFSPFATFAIKFTPYLLMWLVFTLLYIIMPNTKVNFKSAVIAGIVTGTLFQLVQWAYVTFQIGASGAGAVYGSFAALPLFLAWLQTEWIIVLIGCELSYSVQNVGRYSVERAAANEISAKLEKEIAIVIMTNIVKRFIDKQKPEASGSLADKLKISPRLLCKIADKLIEIGILAELKTEETDSRYFIPAVDVNILSINLICNRLENRGNDEDFSLTQNDLLTKIEKELSASEKLYASTLVKDL